MIEAWLHETDNSTSSLALVARSTVFYEHINSIEIEDIEPFISFGTEFILLCIIIEELSKETKVGVVFLCIFFFGIQTPQCKLLAMGLIHYL